MLHEENEVARTSAVRGYILVLVLRDTEMSRSTIDDKNLQAGLAVFDSTEEKEREKEEAETDFESFMFCVVTIGLRVIFEEDLGTSPAESRMGVN